MAGSAASEMPSTNTAANLNTGDIVVTPNDKVSHRSQPPVTFDFPLTRPAAVQEKHPPEWQVEEWKEAVRWFFRAAGTQAAGPSPGPDGCPVGGFGLATGRSDRMAGVESGLPHHVARSQAVWACSGVRPTTGRS